MDILKRAAARKRAYLEDRQRRELEAEVSSLRWRVARLEGQQTFATG